MWGSDPLFPFPLISCVVLSPQTIPYFSQASRNDEQGLCLQIAPPSRRRAVQRHVSVSSLRRTRFALSFYSCPPPLPRRPRPRPWLCRCHSRAWVDSLICPFTCLGAAAASTPAASAPAAINVDAGGGGRRSGGTTPRRSTRTTGMLSISARRTGGASLRTAANACAPSWCTSTMFCRAAVRAFRDSGSGYSREKVHGGGKGGRVIYIQLE